MAKVLTTKQWVDGLGDFIDWNNFSLENEYQGTRKPITILCKRCNKSREFSRASYLSEYTGEYFCENCDERKSMSVLELIDYTEKKRYRNRVVVKNKSKSLKRHDLVTTICNDCGDEKDVLVSSYISCKAGCRKCANSEKFDTNFVKNKIESITDGEYTLLGNYVNAQESIEIQHISENCENHSWNTMYGNFVRHGRRCPKCTFVPSIGEDLIEKFLIEKNINYQKQYRDKRCFYKKTLPFDFAVFDRCDKLSLLIEFDGIQHYSKERGFWGSNYPDEELNKRVICDKIKSDFCNKNNIPLLRISYLEVDMITEILSKELITV